MKRLRYLIPILLFLIQTVATAQVADAKPASQTDVAVVTIDAAQWPNGLVLFEKSGRVTLRGFDRREYDVNVKLIIAAHPQAQVDNMLQVKEASPIPGPIGILTRNQEGNQNVTAPGRLFFSGDLQVFSPDLEAMQIRYAWLHPLRFEFQQPGNAKPVVQHGLWLRRWAQANGWNKDLFAFREAFETQKPTQQTNAEGPTDWRQFVLTDMIRYTDRRLIELLLGDWQAQGPVELENYQFTAAIIKDLGIPESHAQLKYHGFIWGADGESLRFIGESNKAVEFRVLSNK